MFMKDPVKDDKMDVRLLNIRMTITGTLLFGCLRTGNTAIVVAPSNTDAVIGGSTYINCSTSVTSEEIHWFHYDTLKKEKHFVYGYSQFYVPYHGRFQFQTNADTGVFNLVIPSVKIEDAGTYECVEDAGRGAKKSVQLVVLDADPVCHSNSDIIIGPNSCEIEPTQLMLSCMVTYHGNEAPVLEWRLGNYAITHGVNHSIFNNRVVYDIAIMAGKTENGSSYVCHAKRSTSESSCNSRTITVQGNTIVCQDCKPLEIAIICICTIIVLPLCISFIVMFICGWRWKPTGRTLWRAKDVKSNEMTVMNFAADAAEEGNSQNKKDAERHQTKINETEEDRPLTQGDPYTIKEPQSKKLMQEHVIREKDKNIKQLEESIQRRDTSIATLESEAEQRAAEIVSLKSKIAQLEAKFTELEQHPYLIETMEFTDKPELAQTIVSPTTEKNKKDTQSIEGITILDHELFAIYAESPEIEVYDSITFQYNRKCVVASLTFPVDIASSNVNNSLYIIQTVKEDSDQTLESTKSKSTILRLDPKGELLKQWATGGGTGRLSTYESNVIVCLFAEQLIKEYSAEGIELNRVRLSPAAGFLHPLHAIKVNTTYFMVSHGNAGDDMHRVCVVDFDGKIIKTLHKWELSYGVYKTSESFKMPIFMLNIGEGSILVADFGGKRIVILSPILGFQRELIDKGYGLDGRPIRLCFDDSRGRLFVAVNKWDSNKEQWKNGRILVFNVK